MLVHLTIIKLHFITFTENKFKYKGPSFSTSWKKCIIIPLLPVMKQSLFLKIKNFSQNSCDTVANVLNNVTEGQTDGQTHM